MKRFLSCLLAAAMLLCSTALAQEKIVTDEPFSIKLIVEDVGVAGASYEDNLPIYQEIEKRTGVSVDWETVATSSDSAEYDTLISTRLAAMADLPDLLCSKANANMLINSGAIIPLDDLVAQHAPNLQKLLEDNPDVTPTLYSADGTLYFLPSRLLPFEGLAANPITFVVRKDWMDKCGIEKMPETIDEWHDLLVAFRDMDPNGNGLKDETPFCADSVYGAMVFACAWGIDWMNDFYLDENGKVTYAWNTEAARDYLATMRQWFAEGLIAPDYLSDRDMWSRMLEDQVGVSYWGAASGCDWCNDYNEKNPDTCDWLPVDPPKNVYTGEESFLPTANYERVSPRKMAITTACEDPVKAIKWLDYLFSDEGLRLTNIGIEGESYTLAEDGSIQYTPKYWTDADSWENRKRFGLEPPQTFPHVLGMEYFNGISLGYSTRVMERCYPLADCFKPVLPTYTPTEEEDMVLSAAMPDIETYTDEMINKFIIGTEPMEKFDDFVSKLDAIGLSDILEIKQAQYERNNK